jgi:phage terminase small subunit
MRPRWARFISEYIKCGSGTAAAKAAGFRESSAARTAKTLLKNPMVMAEIDRLRKEIMAEGKYGLLRAMKEIEDAMEFARMTKNATALANLLQLRAKINGLIIDKMDHRISGNFQLNIEGIDQVRQVGEAVVVPQIASGVSSGGSGSNS